MGCLEERTKLKPNCSNTERGGTKIRETERTVACGVKTGEVRGGGKKKKKSRGVGFPINLKKGACEMLVTGKTDRSEA